MKIQRPLQSIDSPAMISNGRTIRDGWLYTGDVAVASEDGVFTILDRKKVYNFLHVTDLRNSSNGKVGKSPQLNLKPNSTLIRTSPIQPCLDYPTQMKLETIW